jgi:uncharacterized protein (DUF2062 family)
LINKEKLKKRLKDILSLDSHPGHISAGFAVGVFISFCPFFGLHTMLALVAAFILRINKITCITGTWVNTPLTMAPVFIASYEIGEFILGRTPQKLVIGHLTLKHCLELLESHGLPILIGTSLIGFLAAIISYAVLYCLIVRFRRGNEAQGFLTREMEETGEELK